MDNSIKEQIKKQARRRLLGAVLFASLVAVFLPAIMDHKPRLPIEEVAVHIPLAENSPPLTAPGNTTNTAAAPENDLPLDEADPPPAPAAAVANHNAAAQQRAAEKAEAQQRAAAEKAAAERAHAEKIAAEKLAAEKLAAEKLAAEKAAQEKRKNDEAKRAAAILAGMDSPLPSADNSAKPVQYQILIGAFSNEGNVKVIRSKLGEMKIGVITEALNTPDGKKTRVRAGPFSSQAEAQKALSKMQRIGLDGKIAVR